MLYNQIINVLIKLPSIYFHLYRKWKIQLGAFNLKNETREEWTERGIKEILIHPQFEASSEMSNYDVAILSLESAVQFHNNIRPVCLPEAPTSDAGHLAGAAVSVSGWGKTNEILSSASETLKTAHISVYNQR